MGNALSLSLTPFFSIQHLQYSDFLLLMCTVSELDEEMESKDETALAALDAENSRLRAAARARMAIAEEEAAQREACEKDEDMSFALVSVGEDDMVMADIDAEDDDDENTSCSFANGQQAGTQETGPLPDDDDDEESFMH